MLSRATWRANSAKTFKKEEPAASGKKLGQEESVGERDNTVEAMIKIAAQVDAETERVVDKIYEIVGWGMIGRFTIVLIRVVANQA